jgi:hypothetical protein
MAPMAAELCCWANFCLMRLTRQATEPCKLGGTPVGLVLPVILSHDLSIGHGRLASGAKPYGVARCYKARRHLPLQWFSSLAARER